MTGIDISYCQSAIPPGAWDFIIVQLTHDAHGKDHMADQHFPNALKRAPIRGGYHYANPAAGDGASQAKLLASRALELGFRKDVDLWALDSEEHAEPGAFAVNQAWVRAFFSTGRALLGNRALWYVGWPYYTEHFGSDLALLKEQAWWLPAYGPNDGQPHDPQCPYPPVLHQFTSKGGVNGGGLDVNRVLDTATWAHLTSTGPAPTPTPGPHPTPIPTPQPPAKVKPVISTSSPLRDVKSVHLPHAAGAPPNVVAVALTEDGGIFCPEGLGFSPFTPVGQDYWKGKSAAALAIQGDPAHPLTDAEVAAGKVYAVISTDGARYAYGPVK